MKTIRYFMLMLSVVICVQSFARRKTTGIKIDLFSLEMSVVVADTDLSKALDKIMAFQSKKKKRIPDLLNLKAQTKTQTSPPAKKSSAP